MSLISYRQSIKNTVRGVVASDHNRFSIVGVSVLAGCEAPLRQVPIYPELPAGLSQIPSSTCQSLIDVTWYPRKHRHFDGCPPLLLAAKLIQKRDQLLASVLMIEENTRAWIVSLIYQKLIAIGGDRWKTAA